MDAELNKAKDFAALVAKSSAAVNALLQADELKLAEGSALVNFKSGTMVRVGADDPEGPEPGEVRAILAAVPELAGVPAQVLDMAKGAYAAAWDAAARSSPAAGRAGRQALAKLCRAHIAAEVNIRRIKICKAMPA